ncbi:MAG: AAA family ATPase [Halothece sp.]
MTANPSSPKSKDAVLGNQHPHQDLIQQLDLMLRSRYSMIYLVAAEEEPVEEVLEQVSQNSQPQRQVLAWDMVRGWSDNNKDKGSLMGALNRIRAAKEDEATLFVLCDLHGILKNPETDKNAPVIRELKNLSRDLKTNRKTILFLSHRLEIPPELSEEITVLDVPLPQYHEIDYLVSQLVSPDKIKLQGLAKEQFLKACQGLSRSRIRRVLAKALAAKQEINEADIDVVLEEKRETIRQTGILDFSPAPDSLKRVGGLENLKQWVRTRKDAFSDEARQYGLPTPKGLLLVGIQGTGKSLSAKTIAHEWRLPLLSLDTGRLFGGLVGESESRVRQMIQLAEAMSPCILWIDEIDKAFGNIGSGASGDSGTSERVFGSLITWMQEKTQPVFIVATANNVEVLPAELLRKGRFDEIFFINLPTEKERKDIFRVHLQQLRGSRLQEFNLDRLAKASENFSGAEIQQAVIDAMHLAFGEGDIGKRRDFNTQDIITALEETVPLSAIAHQQIEALKRWAAQAGARTASKDEDLLQELQEYQSSSGIGPIEVD